MTPTTRAHLESLVALVAIDLGRSELRGRWDRQLGPLGGPAGAMLGAETESMAAQYVPRLRVLDLFQHSETRHLTAEDVYRKLLEEHSDIGLATVYRVLTQFEQAGLLVRHHFESGKAVYELNEGGHHDHLVCLQCGRVEEFYDPEIEKRQAKVARERGFAIHDHQLYLYADCIKADCPWRPKE